MYICQQHLNILWLIYLMLSILNINIKILKKRDIKIIYFKSKKTMLKDINNFFVVKKDNINILFHNDKNINANIHKKLTENGVDIELIDAKNKKEQYDNVKNDTISKSNNNIPERRYKHNK